MAFAHVVGAFSLVVKQFPQLSTYAAVLARLSALATGMEATAGDRGGITIAEDPDRLAFERLTLFEPTQGRAIVRELSLEVTRGARVWITMPGEVETAALQRAIAGTWEAGEGRIVRPPAGEIMLLPERPYLPPGTLRELLVEVDRTRVSDAEVWEALRAVGADDAVRRVGGLDVDRGWHDLLSIEEQRLLSVARILVTAPRFAVLARPRTRLGERAARVLEALAERGVGCVVLGEGESELDRERFDVVIEIAPDGSWSERRGQRAENARRERE